VHTAESPGLSRCPALYSLDPSRNEDLIRAAGVGQNPRFGGTESKLVHNAVFCVGQLSRRVPVYSKHIPSRTLGHSAFGSFNQRRVLMQAATMAPTLCPTRFKMQIEGFVAQAQHGYYLGEQECRVGRHPFSGLSQSHDRLGRQSGEDPNRNSGIPCIAASPSRLHTC
jgi:hypothetical protein